MKIIDSKGKLFGKFNIIDLMVVLFIILVIAVGFKFLYSGDEQEIVTKENITVELRFDNLPYYIYTNINEMDMLLKNGKNLSEIKSIRVVDNLDEKKDIIITTTLEISKNNGDMIFNDNAIKIGTELKDLSTENVYLGNADFVGLGNDVLVLEQSDLNIKVRSKAISPWLAEKLSIGIKETIGDNVIAEIKERDVTNHKFLLTTDDGDVYVKENPLKKDIELNIDIKARWKGDNYYYHDKKVSIGNEIYFNFRNIDFSGVVIDIE